MSVSGKACVNRNHGKPSFIALQSTTDVCTTATRVGSVRDLGNGIDFTVVGIPRWTPRHLMIRVHGQGVRKQDVTPPESGTLTVTTTNPTLSPDPTVEVDYVDDPT